MRSSVLILLFSLLSFGMSGCGDGRSKPGEAAIVYYNYLLTGDYEKYVEGMLSCDSLPPDYKARIAITIKQYLAREKQESDGLKTVELVNEVIDDSGKAANVFLDVSYGNGKKEGICVPLVFVDDVWRLQ